MRRESLCGGVAAAVLLLLTAASATDARAQSLPSFRASSTTGIGYSGLFPSAIMGVGAWQFFGSTGIGVFADAKLTVPRITSDEAYCPPGVADCTLDWVREERSRTFPVRDDSDWLTINAGAVYAVSSEFAVMVGAGRARRHEYRLFDEYEEVEPLTLRFSYYVPTRPEPEWVTQLAAGLLIRAGQFVAFHIGYETAPKAVRAGIYIVMQ
jgi:hypothetical protein